MTSILPEWCRRKRVIESQRIIYAQDEFSANKYCNNKISNTKYSLLTFIPLNLLLQVSRHMNRYFLLIAFLQLWQEITPVSPLTTWIPLLFIFALSALREALDDINRWRSDKVANERLFDVIRSNSLEEIQSQDIRVGDVLRIIDGAEFPCDLVVIGTSNPDGSCFVQTANMDGETDLKPRRCVADTVGWNEGQLRGFLGIVECEGPSARVDQFVGRMRVTATDELVSCSQDQLLLQSTHLRNTKWVYGVAIYTGNETRLGMNKSVPPTKWTKADQFINRTTIFIFFLQLGIAAVFGTVGSVKNRVTDVNLAEWYLNYAGSMPFPWYSFIIIPLRFLLLCSSMVPISLKVTVDIVKYAYAKFVDWDLHLYDASEDVPAHVANSNVAEDVGQVEFILSDKTGTLTENMMVFRKCSINAKMYGQTAELSDALQDKSLLDAVAERDPHVMEFFRALTLCNTVMPERVPDAPSDDGGLNAPDARELHRMGSGSFNNIAYKATSPDEEALVLAAAQLGICMQPRAGEEIMLKIGADQRERWRILHVLAFTSDRKRMSALVQNIVTHEAILFCKGADDVIIQRLCAEQESVVAATTNHVDRFAQFGLRTLCIASRSVDAYTLEQWQAALQEANTNMSDRKAALAGVHAMMEKELVLLGCTAIEDRLQDEVPQTIQLLRRAGIRFWMLTGDKMATAEQIALSCSLMSPEPAGQLHRIRGNDADQVSQCLESMAVGAHDWKNREMNVIIDGPTLVHALVPSCAVLLTEVLMNAHAVIACRVSPQQKADLVRLIRAKNITVLAIGDGGNDVGMIQEANVGVGIAGREGLQASRAADYSFRRFRFLKKLLLIHGRYAYTRTALIAQYSFYKSLFICLMQLAFAFVSDFSGTSLFTSFALGLYNVVFTGLPIMLHVLDKDLSEEHVYNNPALYQDSQKGVSLNRWTTATWFARAVFQAAIVIACTLCIYDYRYINPVELGDADLVMVGMVAYTSGMFVQTFTVALETHTWTWLNHLVIWGTLIAYFVVMTVGTLIVPFGFYYVMLHLYVDPNFWFAVGLTTVATMFPIVACKIVARVYFPSLRQRIRSQSVSRHELTAFSDSDSPTAPMLADKGRAFRNTLLIPPDAHTPLLRDGRSLSTGVTL
eukprot:TRINITY_DN4930_c0_g2_i1.p1 TRINITY_DN4930_c0_g2~~TRINITY_DN4930_c0_g2_i1.p1  ORF type:complete len:1133 (+),score=217.67 TRINITY_DN4930_c0_g2_i1:38-3436(+)